jgi:hypothetical protein
MRWQLMSVPSPERAENFIIAIMRHSKSLGTRLLGSIEMGRGEALTYGENRNCACSSDIENWSTFENNDTVAFCLDLMKVNFDGPTLRLTADFSVSEPTLNRAYNRIEILESHSKI